jgi:3-keto-5-aminohexanoate cleavage enzyme
MDTDIPVVLEVAVNGITSRDVNSNVPIWPEEIAEDALACAALGASIVHSHNEDISLTGEVAASRYWEAWRNILEEVPELVVCCTTTTDKDIQTRWSHVPYLAKRGMTQCVFDPGSLNLYPDEIGASSEKLRGGSSAVYANSRQDIQHIIELLNAINVGASVAIYEPGFLRVALQYEHRKLLPKGSIYKLYFGGEFNWITGRPNDALFGLKPTRAALEAYMELMNGTHVPWSVAVLGGDVTATEVARLALLWGGHLRVGIEDYRGVDQASNRELVTRAVELCRSVGRRIATPAEARTILGIAPAKLA